MIPTREIYVKSFGVRIISSEQYEEEAIRTGYDNRIFFYVPDDVFEDEDDYEVSEYIHNNIE